MEDLEHKRLEPNNKKKHTLSLKALPMLVCMKTIALGNASRQIYRNWLYLKLYSFITPHDTLFPYTHVAML